MAAMAVCPKCHQDVVPKVTRGFGAFGAMHTRICPECGANFAKLWNQDVKTVMVSTYYGLAALVLLGAVVACLAIRYL